MSAFLGLNFAVYGVDLLMGQATLSVALITSLINSLSLSLSLSLFLSLLMLVISRAIEPLLL